MGQFICGVERVKRFVYVHLRWHRQQLEKDKQNVGFASMEIFRRMPFPDRANIYSGSPPTGTNTSTHATLLLNKALP